MSYTLKDGYLEILIADSHHRTGECTAGEALKQGMAVTKGAGTVTKASGAEVKQGNLFVVAYYEQSELEQLYAGQAGLIGAIASGKRVVTIGRGARVATDQYVGAIGDYAVGEYLEIGTAGDAGLFTPVESTPTGDAAAIVRGKDGDKLIVELTL